MSRSFTAIVLTLLLFGVASTVYATGPELRIAADCTRSVAPGSTAGVAIELQANTNDTTGQRNEISAIDFVVDFDELRFSMQSADVTLPDLVGEKWLITRTEVNATAGTVHVEIAPKFAYPLPTFGDGAVVQLAVHSLLAAPIGCGPLSFVPGSVVFSSPPLGLPVPPGLLHDGGLAVAVPTVTPTPTRTSTPTLTPTTTLTPTVTLTPVLTLTPTVTVTATVTVTPTPTPECDDDEDCDDGTCTIGCIKGSCGPKFASGIPACLERLLPGGGKKATDCKAEWFVAGAPPSGSKQTCINNDPSCDWDLETADQTPHCRFQLAACLNVDGDPRLSDPKTGAACTSADVLAVTLKAPKISGPGPRNAQNLLTAISNIPSGSQGEVNDKGKVTFSPPVTEVDRCSELFDFTVPLSAGQNGTTKKVTKKLKVDIVGSAPAGKRRGPGDSDALAITCLPCVRATKAKCFVENGTPVIELPDICKRHPLANVTDTEQSFTCGAAPECTQTHTVRITRRSPAVGALESFEALLDPFTDKHGKLRGKKCPLPH